MRLKLLTLLLPLAVGSAVHAQHADSALVLSDQAPASPSQNFTGTTSTLATDGVASVGRRLFEPAAHSNWHRHDGGQLVFAEEGHGFYQERGKPVRWLKAGESGYITAGTPHWHGAAPTEQFTQLVVTFAGATTWLERVTDEDYSRLIKQPVPRGASGAAATIHDKTFPSFDFSRWARFIVRDFFKVQPYEKVVIMAVPSYYPELLDAIRAELLEARAIEMGTILFDEREVDARRRAVMPRASDPHYRAQTDAARRRLYENADVFLWLPYRYTTGNERGDRRSLEHLVEGTSARGLHFHWVQNLDQLTQDEVDALSRMYADALDIDYAALSAHHDRLIAALRHQTLHITNAAGTDLRVHVPADTWFHKGDGVMDRERAATARSVRDREMELPAGALRFIPDVNTAEGVLAVPSWAGGENVRFHFQAGRVTKVTAVKGEEQVLRAWTGATGDKDKIGELVIGANPKLPSRGPGQRPPYYGYGAGVLRIAIGENWESGGTNRSSLETSFYITDATIVAGKTHITNTGKLVVP